MFCPVCKYTYRRSGTHSPEYIRNNGMCWYCLTGKKKPFTLNPPRKLDDPTGKISKHHVIVTPRNIELYCKLSQIIRDKPCKPKVVLKRQFRNKEILP